MGRVLESSGERTESGGRVSCSPDTTTRSARSAVASRPTRCAIVRPTTPAAVPEAITWKAIFPNRPGRRALAKRNLFFMAIPKSLEHHDLQFGPFDLWVNYSPYVWKRVESI